MSPRFFFAAGCYIAVALHVLCWPAAAQDAEIEFFEKQVRPILVARCYECHSGKSVKLQGGLRLDSLAAATKGGDTGPAVVPGKPKESLLVDAINYGELYQMPPKTRLPPEEVAALTKWVEMGAPWPREAIPTAGGTTNSFDLQQRKAEHWCWQPITSPPVPQIRNPKSKIQNPIDAFILVGLESKGLSPAPPADPRTLIRRLYFDLIGLPPSAEEVEAFVAAVSPSLPPSVPPSGQEGETERQRDRAKAVEAVVDSLLASPHFGERWGRHWLDLVRYAESRGHEFDPNIPNAFEYRDYVIRALNADVPYDQFVIEHVAGDLLDKPRLHPTEGWNESIIGTGFWFLGEWIHSPVDIRKDECDRVDNQIDVFSKTFLGLTVSCARCHDHKFDAISQADYYALAGYLQSSSYRLTRFETWERDRKLMAKLTNLEAHFKPLIAAALAKVVESKIDALSERLAKVGTDDLAGPELGVPVCDLRGSKVIVDYSAPAAGQWMTDGPTFGTGPVLPGQLAMDTGTGLPLEAAVYGAARRYGTWENLAVAALSEGDQGRLGGWLRAGRTLKTPKWTLDSGQVHYLIEGAGHVYAAVDSHAMINGPLHNELAKDTGGDSYLPMRWITHDLSRYAGHRVHLEFSPKEGEDFRILMVVEGPRPKAPELRANVLIKPGMDVAECRALIKSTLELLKADKIAGNAHAPDLAGLINWLIVQSGEGEGLSHELKDTETRYYTERQRLVSGFRAESRICLAMWDGTPTDEHLLIRGNHKTIGPVVPRRLLAALASGGRQPPEAEESGITSRESGSGRLELARRLVNSPNPLTSRVIVNRVWQHLFGRGIVPSVDNFGVLGEPPTHPELLDYLAREFIQDGWSLKRLIRRIVLSQTYQQASGGREPPETSGDRRPETGDRAEVVDPQNLLFHRQNLRRLEGEAIRDAILAVSGRLDRTQFGPSVPVHLTPFMQGRGRPGTSGPLDGNGRRSIYIAVRRNFLSPMMLAFDTPIPASTVGRRNVSNVPAQALILMNDPFVAEQSRVWARKLLADASLSQEACVRRMYLEALSREPTTTESSAALSFLEDQSREYGVSAPDAPGDLRVWADLGHVLYNSKEFVLVP